MGRTQFNNGDPKHRSWRLSFVWLLAALLVCLVAGGAAAQDEQVGGLELQVSGAQGELAEVEAPLAETWIQVTRDSFVSSNQPNQNFGFDSSIRFGFRPDTQGALRPLLFFDLGTVPTAVNITRAEVHIYLNAATPANDIDRAYGARALAAPWNESSVTWNNMPTWGPDLGTGTASSAVGWRVVDVTELVREWQRNPGGNHGLILVGDERPGQNHERNYFAKEANNGLFPRLRVIFDENIDTTPPQVTVTHPTPPGGWSPANFTVRWTGFDPDNPNGTPGSGIRWYDVFYSENQGPWIIGRAQVTTLEANVINARHLSRYDFFARGRDHAGNEVPEPSGPSAWQTWTRVDAEPPQARVNPLPQYTATPSFTVSWSDSKEQNESGISSFEVQWREDGGAWQTLAFQTTATSTTFIGGRNGVLYEFRARGIDAVGNQQPFGDAQAATTVWLEPVAYIVPFSPVIFQKTSGPAPGDQFTVSWVGLTPPGTSINSFDVRYQRPGNPNWISWLNGTAASSANFVLDVDDPDGEYFFQARATNSNGVTGPFNEELQARIIVDRRPPFIEPRVYFAGIFNE
jgi:hypothetical protein